MEDVQNTLATVALPIDSVGVRNLRLPISVSRREGGALATVALLELGVDLPAHFKGTHMSRFIEVLQGRQEDLSYKSIKSLLEDILERLHARKARVIFDFPFFMPRPTPVSKATALQSYQCRITGELALEGKLDFILEVKVPVMTVCPCSKAISREGAHSQRAEIRLLLHLKNFCWLEEFIEIAESAGSAPTYPLLKREDEKFVTEQSFANPCFVEDVVRNIAEILETHPHISWFRAEVESFESIHAHNAYAWIERYTQPDSQISCTDLFNMVC
ncbi:MAG: GTP cyclohydrolase FolE2 [Desulfovibrio sp.]|jgi:GTP cyclohydrolase I|nr:GTP cyclohydrolase FolE2 [Desulfovibrio sp.]